MSEHAKLSASESHRWMHCPGSVRKNRKVKRKSSASATKGTAAHALGAYILERHPDVFAQMKQFGSLVGWTFRFKDGGVWKTEVATPEMLDAVRIYVDHIEGIIRSNSGAKLLLEHRVSLEHVRPNMFGTADAIVDDIFELTVADYKNGVTPVILVEEGFDPANPDVELLNTQLMFYGAGAAHKFGWSHLDVTLKVVQPNCREVEAIQSVTINSRLLREWMEGPLWKAAMATEDPNAPLRAGKWCDWCPSNGDCTEFTRHAVSLAKADFKGIKEEEGDLPVPPDPHGLTNVQLARILKWTPTLDKWLKACNATAFERLAERRGEGLGQKLVRKRANRAFPSGLTPAQVAKKLNAAGADGLKAADLLTEPELKSPAQVEKLLKGSEAARRKIVDAVAIKPDTGLTMAPLADKRPEELPPSADLKNIVEEDTGDDGE